MQVPAVAISSTEIRNNNSPATSLRRIKSDIRERARAAESQGRAGQVITITQVSRKPTSAWRSMSVPLKNGVVISGLFPGWLRHSGLTDGDLRYINMYLWCLKSSKPSMLQSYTASKTSAKISTPPEKARLPKLQTCTAWSRLGAGRPKESCESIRPPWCKRPPCQGISVLPVLAVWKPGLIWILRTCPLTQQNTETLGLKTEVKIRTLTHHKGKCRQESEQNTFNSVRDC